MVYLLEDDESIRRFVIYALRQTGMEAEGFPLPSLFKEAVEHKKPDIALLDIMLPEEDGISVLKWLRSRHDTKQLPVIMLTAKSTEYDKVVGLDSGADDYIAKPFVVEELVARVKAHLRRESRNDISVGKTIKVGEIEIRTDSFEVFKNGEPVPFSTREFQLLQYLMENAGKVLTREQIFSSVWDTEYGDMGTVAVNIKSIRDKIDPQNEYIKTVWGVGYKFVRTAGK